MWDGNDNGIEKSRSIYRKFPKTITVRPSNFGALPQRIRITELYLVFVIFIIILIKNLHLIWPANLSLSLVRLTIKRDSDYTS